MNIQKELDLLMESTIDSMNFNIARNEIVLYITTYNQGFAENLTLSFNDVSSYYFIHGIGKDRFDIPLPEPDDYTELSLIGYHPNGVGKILIESEKAWANPWYSSANFVLELWSSNLFIEAQTVTINDKIFKVGVPEKYNY